MKGFQWVPNQNSEVSFGRGSKTERVQICTGFNSDKNILNDLTHGNNRQENIAL